MSDSKSNLGVILILLVLVVAGYQAITQVGNYVADELLGISQLQFWAAFFFALLGFCVIFLGVKLGDFIKEL